MDEVARIQVDAERHSPIDRGEQPPGGHEVVGDLCWMDFEAATDALLVEYVEDWGESRRNFVDSLARSRRNGWAGMNTADARSGSP